MNTSGLPAPGEAASAHGARVAAHIGGLIDASGGAIGFSEYMEQALYAPGLGYYSAGSRKFGAEGDFVTAPEISPLFARCLARQLAEVAGDGGDTVLEIGAGSGRLAADLLKELQALDALPARYLVLEVSAELRARQRDALQREAPELAPRVQWLDAWPDRPLQGAILANEVLDALPFEVFGKRNDSVMQRVVVRDGAGFGWSERPAPSGLSGAVAAIERECGSLPDGYVSEVRLQLPAWLASASDTLDRGAMLFIDYGMSRSEYYAPERGAGTLMCHYRQRAHEDPFVWPGLQDITAHVDFTAVAGAADACGLDVAGYTTQAHFLLGCGIDRLVGDAPTLERSQQARRLLLPSGMGERFKVIALTREVDRPLRGFGMKDLRSRL